MFAIEAAAEVVEPSVNTDESESSPEAVDVVPITTIAELDAIPQPFTFDEVILEPSIVYNGPNSLISDKVDFQQVASQPEPKNKARRSSNQQFEYIDALVTAQKKLTQERVYVFVAGAASLSMDQGQLVILESGSSIRDALEYMQETVPEVFSQESKVLEVCGRESDDVREPCSSPPSEPRVWRNGQLAQLGDCIRNGDVLLMEL
eukprot:Sro1_g000050.1 Putative GTP diphosphokinase RSH1, chloroplastic (205) ;mRNA; r:16000-16614